MARRRDAAHAGTSTQDAGRAPLTDFYESYDFTDLSGPGCGDSAHPADCLHDVDVSKIDPEQKYAPGVGYASVATKVSGGVPDSPPAFYRWASELLGLFEAVQASGRGAEAAAHFEALRSTYQEKRTSFSGGKFAVQEEVRQLLRSGLTIEATANFLFVTPVEVVRLFTRGYEPESKPWIEAERLLRKGAASYSEIARKTGLSKQQVDRLADVIGHQPATATNRAAGGGLTVTAEQYDRIRILRERGVSTREIAQATGLKANTVYRICKRRGYEAKAA